MDTEVTPYGLWLPQPPDPDESASLSNCKLSVVGKEIVALISQP